LTVNGFPFNIDLNRVFDKYQNKRIPIGYFYGGIKSPVPTLITPGQNYLSTVNRNLYRVYMKLAVPVH
jgi:hypothetical protein